MEFFIKYGLPFGLGLVGIILAFLAARYFRRQRAKKRQGGEAEVEVEKPDPAATVVIPRRKGVNPNLLMGGGLLVAAALIFASTKVYEMKKSTAPGLVKVEAAKAKSEKPVEPTVKAMKWEAFVKADGTMDWREVPAGDAPKVKTRWEPIALPDGTMDWKEVPDVPTPTPLPRRRRATPLIKEALEEVTQQSLHEEEIERVIDTLDAPGPHQE